MALTTFMTKAWSYRSEADFSGQYVASDPTILVDGNLLRMFYTDWDWDGGAVRPVIAEAVSSDGVTWTQIGGNTGTGIVVSPQGGARANVEGAAIFKAGDTYVLLYSGYADGNQSAGDIGAQLYAATSTDGITFTDVSPDPILAPTAGWYDNDAVFCPTVIAHDGGYVMIYAGHNYNNATLTNGEFGVWLLGATSPDGLNWTKLDAPVLAGDAAFAWMAGGVAEPCLTQGPDGKFYLFFTGLSGGERSIGLAVADDPFGPWTIAPEPIVTAASAGVPPGGIVIAPHAELANGVLRLWFTKMTADGIYSIGYMESDWGGGGTPVQSAANRIGTDMDDQIFGDDGSDAVQSLGGNDLVVTAGGQDTIDAGAGEDAVWSGTGDDHVLGGSGNDILYVEEGDDTVDAGDGDDVAAGGDGADQITTGLGQDIVDGGSGNDVIDGGDGDDVLYGNDGSDTVDGGAGIDMINGGAGSDILRGGAGDDILIAGEEDDATTSNALDGGTGADALVGFAGADTLDGGADNDVIYAGWGNDVLIGGDGADMLFGEDGDDRLAGGAGGDILAGGLGTDTADYTSSAGVTVALDGSVASTGDAAGDYLDSIETLVGSASGNDWLIGDAAANHLEGRGGNDTLDGRGGADTLLGGLGDDVFILDNMSDVVVELVGQGSDTIRTTLATYTLAAVPNVENLTYSGFGSFVGTGNAAANMIAGGAGADTLIGGLGADILAGGAGRDTFRYMNSAEGGDVLADFAPLDDKIQISAAGFGGGLAAGALASNRFVLGTTPNRAFGQFLYDRPAGRLLWDSDGTGAAAPIQLATMGSVPGPSLVSTNITVV